jgi:hypothetical protein
MRAFEEELEALLAVLTLKLKARILGVRTRAKRTVYGSWGSSPSIGFLWQTPKSNLLSAMMCTVVAVPGC